MQCNRPACTAGISTCCFWRNLADFWLFSLSSLPSWLWLLCPDHSWAEQTQHHGGDPILDGTWSGDTEGIRVQSGHLVTGDNGHRDDWRRTPLPQWESPESKRISFCPLFLLWAFWLTQALKEPAVWFHHIQLHISLDIVMRRLWSFELKAIVDSEW